MAKKKPAETPAVATLDPDAIYRVQLARAVPYGRMILRPQDEVKLKGKVIADLGDAVASYEKI